MRRAEAMPGLLLLLLHLSVGPAVASRVSVDWRIESLGSGSLGLLAVASSDGPSRLPGRDRLEAVGGARGLRIREGNGPWRRYATRSAVTALAFDRRRDLWVGTHTGLLRVSGARVEDRSPAPGEGARRIARVTARGDAVAVATGAGVFVLQQSGLWRRVGGAIGQTSARGLAWATAPGGLELLIATDHGLFVRAPGADQATRASLPLGLRPAVDVIATSGAAVALGLRRVAERRADGVWRVHPLVPPPGALPLRIAHALGRWLLATDGGLAEAPSLAGPWQRAQPPAGTAAALDVAGDETHALVATPRGLLTAVLRETVAEASATVSADPAATPVDAGAVLPTRGCDPPISEVHRTVLAYTQLDGAQVAEMWRGVRRRGWLPLLSLRGVVGQDRLDGEDFDESFLSGDTRRLHDRDRDRRRDAELSLSLTWDLGDGLFHPEEIDVSTEARRRIELRDDVLDEVNQLYFDRQRALREARGHGPEAELAHVRAAELAAGIDGWTDDWFGTRAGTVACSPP